MRSIHGLSVGLAAILLAAANAQADTGGSVVVQSSAAISETAAVNTDLAAAHPDLIVSGNGFVFSTNASNTVLPGTTIAPLGRNFTSAQMAA